MPKLDANAKLSGRWRRREGPSIIGLTADSSHISYTSYSFVRTVKIYCDKNAILKENRFYAQIYQPLTVTPNCPSDNVCLPIVEVCDIRNLPQRRSITQNSSGRNCPTAEITPFSPTRSDRRTDRSVRPRLRPTVCQTSRTDRLDRL